MTSLATKEQVALIPFGEIERMGSALAKSQLFGMKTPEQAVALMLVAQAQGRHPASVAMEYDVIQGRPALKAQAALARFQNDGGQIEWLERTDQRCSARFTHPMGGELVVTWDLERAKKMGLLGKDNWNKQPMVMLSWRVVAEGVRAVAPGCLGGSYLVEEVQDFEPPKAKNVTPPRPRKSEEEVFHQTAPAPEPAPEAEPEPEPQAIEPEVLPPEPPVEAPPPSPPPAGARLSSEGQQKNIHRLLKKCSIEEPEARAMLKDVSADRTDSTKGLTMKEAGTLIDILKERCGEA